jgi:hypothetical protein
MALVGFVEAALLAALGLAFAEVLGERFIAEDIENRSDHFVHGGFAHAAPF